MLLVLSATLVELNSSPQAFHSVSTTIRETFKIFCVEHVNASIGGSTGGELAGPQMPNPTPTTHDPTEIETEYGEHGRKNPTQPPIKHHQPLDRNGMGNPTKARLRNPMTYDESEIKKNGLRMLRMKAMKAARIKKNI